MKKYLRVTMADKSRWDVPVDVIARNRATYYSQRDDQSSFEEEYQATLADEDMLLDWAVNNMDWDDVKDRAKMVQLDRLSLSDYQDGWINGEKMFLEY